MEQVPAARYVTAPELELTLHTDEVEVAKVITPEPLPREGFAVNDVGKFEDV
jgi:hypothetical protein